MTFTEAVDVILGYEGEGSNDPYDTGGLTRFGIAQSAYPGLDVSKLTRDGAIALYKRDYWDKLSCELLPSRLRLLVFDCGVNQGPNAAIRLLQKSLRIKADGIIGKETLDAAALQCSDRLLKELASYRMGQYCLHPQAVRYGLGWARRLMDALYRSLLIKE